MKRMNKLLVQFLFGWFFVFLAACSPQNPPATETPTATLAEDTTTDVSDSSDDTTLAVETISGNSERLYSLDWILDDNEVLAYKTAMTPVESSSASISFNFNQFFTNDDVIPNDIRQQLADIKLPETFSLVSLLEKNSDGNISVKMIVDEVDLPEAESDNPINEGFSQLLGAMEGTVQLRGELTPDGEIASFYLEQKQRNLLAIFFELPTNPVQVGDSWEIDVNCLSMGNGFIVDHAERINRVEFTELTENSDGSPVAVLDYVIAETVEGDIQAPFSDKSIQTSMTCTFLGQGLFLIDEGRWEQLLGELAIKGSGIMDADTVQQFALTPLDDVPEEYIGQQ